jgi:PAS domain S-box-containing protein
MTIDRLDRSAGKEHGEGEGDLAAAEERAFQDFFENSTIALHWVGPDGTILRVNHAELEWLGYAPDEYVGHNIAEFHEDEHVIGNLIDRLKRGETIRDFPSRLRCRDGSFRDVLIDSSVLWHNGEWVHTRCVTRDNTPSMQTRREFEAAIKEHQAMEERLTLLVEASGSLIESLELRQMLPEILGLSRGLIAADAYALWSLDSRTGAWSIASSDGLSDAYLRDESSIPADADTPRPTEPMLIEDVESEPRVKDRVEGYQREGVRSLLVLPVLVAGEPHATLTFYSRTPQRYSDIEVRVASALANLAASAITAARLHAEQQSSSAGVEEANLRLRFLSQASALLASSLDYETTLQNLAQLAVPWLTDWCAVNVVDEDGSAPNVAFAHVDPAKVAWVRELGERYPPDPAARYGIAEVLRTGATELIAEITDEMLVAAAIDEEHLQIARSLGLTASLCVPMIAHGRVVGALTLVHASEGRRFAPEDVELAEELARRAASAIDNAQLYRKLQAAVADLERANAAKDDFLGMVSHELKTPITTIIGNADVLLRLHDQIDPGALTEALQDINDESNRLHRLIENLLVLSRVEGGGAMDLEPILVRRDTQQVVEAHHRRYPHRVIDVKFPKELWPVKAEPTYFEQVLQNLLSNAEKYSPNDQPIEVHAEVIDGMMTISVLDRGTGIDPEDAGRIFEPFVRLRQTETSASGAGIGLAVCKRLMEVQGGSIEAAPREGGGLRVTFRLHIDSMAESIGT